MPRPERPPRLLVVDDEARILAALRRSLRREGYDLVLAESGQEGLERLREDRFDLILSDHKMPGMSGLDFLERAESLLPGVPKVLITGWTEAVHRDRIRALGVRELIPKPWDDAELKQALRRVLGSGAGDP